MIGAAVLLVSATLSEGVETEGNGMIDAGGVVLLIVSIILSGVVGYIVGAAKTFREQKLKAYSEILPILVKTAFDLDNSDQREFNKAILGCWLFASKKVAQKVNDAHKILIKHQRGDCMKALQEVIASMRADIQFWPTQRLKPEEIDHIATRLVPKASDPGKSPSPDVRPCAGPSE